MPPSNENAKIISQFLGLTVILLVGIFAGFQIKAAWMEYQAASQAVEKTQAPKFYEAGSDAPRRVERYKALKTKAAQEKFDVLFIGDSITQAWESTGQSVWQKYLAPLNAGNFGIAGDRINNLLYRLDKGNLKMQEPKLIVLLIGTNDMPHAPSHQVSAGIQMTLNKLLSLFPKTKILLVAIFPRDEAPNSILRQRIYGTNHAIKYLANNHKQITFLDINDGFLQSTGALKKDLMPDGHHLSTEGYQYWAQSMLPTVKKLLSQ